MLIMTMMWSASSFSNYLLNFLNKYLEGSIYSNNYYEGLAGVLSTIVGAYCYAKLGKRKAFIISFTLALLGGLLVYSIEAGLVNIPSSFLASFAGTSKVRHTKAVAYLVPKLTFIAKFGIALAFLCTYQASFSDETLFPVQIRATIIGTCQIIARGLTILAPEITELPSPQPIMYFVIIAGLALLTSFAFDEEFK
jgi:hypothetical protein